MSTFEPRLARAKVGPFSIKMSLKRLKYLSINQDQICKTVKTGRFHVRIMKSLILSGKSHKFHEKWPIPYKSNLWSWIFNED